ncbi:phage protein NinX family protein [Pseudomonas chlororaphis]|uniref:phage protein NinX family protein n=1 Tax=Pseudomonas chlororaphis TaxID=587753 RepID=UPI00236626C8|nr:phage protein NinX family protein [Pseudomonas chlororaphis]WDH24077.1 DUF2591 family protein [Pseudomonas chlororaphis]
MTEMIEVKTVDLAGPALDWAVAQVDGVKTIMLSVKSQQAKKPFALFGSIALSVGGDDHSSYAPSTCWHCGGPLIDKHIGNLYRDYTTEQVPTALINGTAEGAAGPSYLVAACRAIVAAKLGEVVSIPKELMP